MRIRKHASKILGVALSCQSSPASSQASLIWQQQETAGAWQLCVLNRSPWDVTPSPPPSPDLYPRCDLQAAVEEDGIKVKEEQNQISSIKNNNTVRLSAMDSAAKDNDDAVDDEKKKKKIVLCKKTDGKKWSCKRLALNHHSFCDHHLNQLRSHNKSRPSVAINDIVSAPPTNTRRKVVTAASVGAGEAVAAADGSSFYYYAGFGPCSRSKRRGGGALERAQEADEGGISELREEDKQMVSNSSAINGDGEEEEDRVESEKEKVRKACSVKKKRGRKRMKARSLRSLL